MTKAKKLKACATAFLAALAAALAVSQPAEAAVEPSSGNGELTETFSANYGSSGSPLVSGNSEELTLSDFNPALGTLTAITITLVSKDTLEWNAAEVMGKNGVYSDASASLPVSVTAPAGLTTTATGEAGPFSGTVSFPRSTAAVLVKSRDTATSSAEVAPSDFPLYEGAGKTFDVEVRVLDGIYRGSGTPVAESFFGNGQTTGSVEVTYHYYSAVPEPGTLAAGLAILGCCGLSLIRRERV